MTRTQKGALVHGTTETLKKSRLSLRTERELGLVALYDIRAVLSYSALQ